MPRRRPRRVTAAALALAAAILGACSADLTLPAGAQVTCGSDADCPSGWICPATLRRCVRPGGDQVAPALVPGSLAVLPPRVGRSTATVTFTFEVTEALAADPEVSIRLAGPAPLTRTLPLQSRDVAAHRYTYAYAPVPASDPEGEVAFVARFVDLAGNEGRVDLPGAALLDFTAPALALDTLGSPVVAVTLTPPATSPLRTVTAATIGTVLRVEFASAEVLAGGAAAPVVTLGAGGSALALGQLSGNGLSYVYQAVVGAGLADGPAPLTAHLTDLAGNGSDLTLATVTVKTTPPASPAVGTADAILFHRVPWGAASTAGAEAYFLRGLGGAVPASATVIAYSDPLVISGAGSYVGREIARTTADPGGAFGGDAAAPTPFQLFMGDAPDLYVAAVDAAGNVSDADPVTPGRQAALVRDVAWTATMGGKVPGRTVPNPHAFEGRQVWTPTLAQYSAAAIPVATPTDVALPDAARASVRGAPHWEPTRAYAPLSARFDNTMAYDPVRGCRMTFGGQYWDGCESGYYCAHRESCRGGPWRTAAALDPEGDGNPSPGTDEPLVFAGGRGTVVLHDGTDLWEWNGASWRRFAMTDPEGDGNPAPRTRHAIAYDEARQRVLLFGGTADSGGATLADTWESDFRSWRRVCTTAPCTSSVPPGRSAHAMVYDPIRKVTLLVGGHTSPTTYDAGTWTWDGAAGLWTRRCNTGTCAIASQRESAALAFDPTLGHAVLFGGSTSGGIDGATFEWDGTAWTQRCTGAPCTTSAPAPRASAAMVHDLDRGRTVLSGGQSTSNDECGTHQPWICGTEWEWDGATWTSIHPPAVGPPTVTGVQPVYDPSRDRVVLFGGSDLGVASSATYLWDGFQWSAATPATVPTARSEYAAAWVQNGGGLVMMANGTGAAGQLGAASYWNGTNWGNYAAYPSARTNAAMAMSTRTSPGAVLFGGKDTTLGYPNFELCDTWEFIWGSGWTQVRNGACGTVEPPAREGHAMVRAYGGQGPFAGGPVVMFGGVTNGLNGAAGNGSLNDVWTWTGTGAGTWTLVSADGLPSSTKPPARTGAGLLYDSSRNRVLMFGGNHGGASGNLNCVDSWGGLACHDFWEWSGSAWTRVYPVDVHGDGGPAPGALAGMAYDTTRSRGVGLESGGTTFATWWWSGGGTDRPGEVLSVVFDAAQVIRPFDLLDLQVTWVGGGTGAPGGATTDGATVQLWDNTAWRQIGFTGAGAAAPRTIAWTLLGDGTYGAIPPAERRRFLVGDARTLHLALVPTAASGSATGMGEVATDYAEVTVKYRLAP